MTYVSELGHTWWLLLEEVVFTQTHCYIRYVLIQIFIFLFSTVFTELSTAPDTNQSLNDVYNVSKKTVRLIQNEF